MADPEEEWTEKIFNECEDEFFESFGVYDGKASAFFFIIIIFIDFCLCIK